MFTLSFVLVTIEINDLVLFHQIFILPSVFAMYGFFTFSDFDTTSNKRCEYNKNPKFQSSNDYCAFVNVSLGTKGNTISYNFP